MSESDRSTSKGSKQDKSLATEARKNVKRARTTLETSDWKKVDEKATFYLAEAQVLATLDLADAIRANGGLTSQ